MLFPRSGEARFRLCRSQADRDARLQGLVGYIRVAVCDHAGGAEGVGYLRQGVSKWLLRDADSYLDTFSRAPYLDNGKNKWRA